MVAHLRELSEGAVGSRTCMPTCKVGGQARGDNSAAHTDNDPATRGQRWKHAVTTHLIMLHAELEKKHLMPVLHPSDNSPGWLA
jgi:hypothetical protein